MLCGEHVVAERRGGRCAPGGAARRATAQRPTAEPDRLSRGLDLLRLRPALRGAPRPALVAWAARALRRLLDANGWPLLPRQVARARGRARHPRDPDPLH